MTFGANKSVVIDREAREIMHLVAFVRLSVRLTMCVCGYVCRALLLVCLSVISGACADNRTDAVDQLLIFVYFQKFCVQLIIAIGRKCSGSEIKVMQSITQNNYKRI